MLDTKAVIDVLRAHLDARDSWRLSDDQHLEFVCDVEIIANLAAAIQVDEAAQDEERGLHTRQGRKDLAVLLRDTLNLAPSEAKKRTRLAHALPRLPRTRKALCAGVISGQHAVAIVNAVEHLPEDGVAEAEALLADYAPRLTPTQLTTAGKRIRTQIDPDGTYRDEHEARKQRSLRMSKDQNGNVRIIAQFPPEDGAKIEVALHAISNPRPVGGQKDPRTTEQRYADGLCELVHIAMSTTKLPSSGGIRPQVIVTIPYTHLRDSFGCGETATGTPLSAALVQEMACDSDVIRAVLNSEGVPLDVGRRHRTAPPGLRKALAIRDKGCAFPGCDRPPSWTEAHHVVHWINGGPTSLDNMVLLCKYHHDVVHEGDWVITFNNGIPEFIPPRWVDPDQRPMRSIRLDPRLAIA